jgi:hypothetical protein
MTGRRLSDDEFLAVLATPEPGPPGWALDERGRFLALPVAERDLAWMLDCCRDTAEGDWHMLRDGDAVLFAHEPDLNLARYLTL